MMRYAPKTKPVPPPCGRDCPGRAPGCSAMCCSWMLYQSIREHIYQKQLAEKHAQKNPYLQETTEIIRGWLVYAEDLGQRPLAKLTPGLEDGNGLRTNRD